MLHRRVAFIGLGRMGLPMASRLLAAGHELIGYDVAPAAAAAAARAGIPTVGSAAASARQSDFVITILPDPPAVEQAASAPDGALAGLTSGSVWVEMTSSDPDVTRGLARAAADRSAVLLDAPVSGGVTGAREGTLAIACAGPEPAFERARPLLEVMGDRIVHVSDRPGDGDLAKTINNLLSAANLTIAAEGLALAMRAGLDGTRLIEYVNSGSGASKATEAKIPRYALSGAFDAGFTFGQYLKDLRIALAVARRYGLDLEMAEDTARLWQELGEAAGSERDHTLLVRLVAERCGVSWFENAPAPSASDAAR